MAGAASEALLKAAVRGRADAARAALDGGADIDATDGFEWTALHMAAAHGHEAVARLLLERGASVDKTESIGETASELAVQYGQTAQLRLLLSYGASPPSILEWRMPEFHAGDVPLVRDCRAAVEDAVRAAGDRDVARLCGDYVSMVDRWRAPGR